MAQNVTPDAQVLIAGGGPVGSLAAYLLASEGVEVVLLDANPELVTDYRASTFHPPTLDLLERSGVSDALVRMGLQCPVIQYRDRREGRVAELDLSILADDTRYPYRLQCEQFKLTGWLHEQLRGMPTAELLMGRRVIGVHEDGDGVTVTVESADGERRWRARYLLGCDGGRSTVRAALDIPFEGYTHPEQFLVAGTKHDFRATMADIRSVNYTADPGEWFLLLEIPDMWRIVVPVAPSVAGHEAESDHYIQACLQNICPADTDYEILVKAVYRVHQRVAATYRRGRSLLVGDAAHVNNPLGGMGLNGGLHDALVLADALGRVIRGEDGERALDAYEATRRPVAINDINAMTERNKRILEERDPVVRRETAQRLRRICADPQLAYGYALEVSMIRSLRSCGLLPDRSPDPARLPAR